MLIVLFFIGFVMASFVVGVFAVAVYRVATGTDAASRAAGPDVKVQVSEKVVAVMSRGGRKWYHKKREVIQ
jgi:hypothetical protein